MRLQLVHASTEDGSVNCEGCSPISLRPISYFGSIWELYSLDQKTKVFCRKENQLHFPMHKGLTVPKQCLQSGQNYHKCLIKFQPNLSAQAQMFLIFEKKLSLDHLFCNHYSRKVQKSGSRKVVLQTRIFFFWSTTFIQPEKSQIYGIK